MWKLSRIFSLWSQIVQISDNDGNNNNDGNDDNNDDERLKEERDCSPSPMTFIHMYIQRSSALLYGIVVKGIESVKVILVFDLQM